MPVQITEERADSPDAVPLIEELEAHLAEFYAAASRHGLSVERLVRERVAFFVTRQDGAPAGCGGVQLFGREYAEIKRMWVRPGFRGRGLGRLMLQHLTAHARTHGARLLRLETGIHQHEAIALYERCGFRQIPPFGPYWDDPVSRCYEKDLTMPSETPHVPSPELFFDTIFAHQKTAALKAAIELEVFTAIGDGARTPAAIAARCTASERGIRILCDYLTVIGFLTKAGGTYDLTPDSAFFLTKRSPAYLGGTSRFLNTPDLVKNFDRLAATIRRGTVAPDSNTVSEQNPIWVEFARAMVPMMMPAAQAIADLVGAASAGPMRVLDIAAGHGIFGITIAQRNPSAEVVAVDWAPVLAVATENATAMGVGARHSTRPGDAFTTDFGTGYDVALMTNFLHHFDVPTNVALLRKTAAALTHDGRIAILEMVPNDDRVSPPLAAGFAVTMLAGTPAGDAFTLRELRAMLTDAGFGDVTAHPLPGPEQVILARRRPGV